MNVRCEETLNAHTTVANEPIFRGKSTFLKCHSGKVREQDRKTPLAGMRSYRYHLLLPEEDAVVDAEDDEDDVDPFTPGDLRFHAK